MNRVLVAVDESCAAQLARCGVDVSAWCDPAALEHALAAAGHPGLAHPLDGIEAVVVPADHPVVGPLLTSGCDRRGVRIVAVAEDAVGWAEARALGIVCVDAGEPWGIADALAGRAASPAAAAEEPDTDRGRGRVVVVWGPAGAPGRSTVATLLAAELARSGRRVGLVDADAHAPSLGLLLGLADEGPGFAAACRAAAGGALDADELDRIAQTVATPKGAVSVLCGVNRPGRWPELDHHRVTAALDACRDWADYTVVDVAASLERDEEIVSDLDGPRRNAATLAAIAAADAIVAVGSADPVGASRLLRALTDLRAESGTIPVRVVLNRLRPGALGVDARGQLRRALERFAGFEDVWFLPLDQRAADAAVLGARLVGEVAPRSPLVIAMRRFVGEALVPAFGGRADRDEPASIDARRRGLRRAVPASAPSVATEPGETHTVLPVVLQPRVRARGRERRSA